MEGRAGDVVSVMPTNLGGAIYAAEFLKRFVRPTTAWAHIDLFAWNQRDRPGRPAGGEAQTLLTALAAIVDRFAISPNRSMSK
jgi:leucyl aminopeptidase